MLFLYPATAGFFGGMNDPLTQLLLQNLLLTQGICREEAIRLWLDLRNNGDQAQADRLVEEINKRSAHHLWPSDPERSGGGEWFIEPQNCLGVPLSDQAI